MENKQEEKVQWTGMLTVKMGIITAMALLLLIPLGMIKGIIGEREQTANATESDISAQWGGAQTLVGPVLNVPVETARIGTNGELLVQKSWLYLMPMNFKMTTHLLPEVRYRGIYKTAVYNSESLLAGDFVIPEKLDDVDGTIDWEKAYLTFGIGDNRGIRGDVGVLWNGVRLGTQSGMVCKDICKTGFSVKLNLTEADLGKTFAFEVKLDLSGSKSFSVLPLGQNTSIKMDSPWNDPSFVGTLLPQKRAIDEKGFQAEWTLTHLNRNFPQYWVDGQFDVWEHQLGVDLFLPVNHYQKAYRSAKYGILFVALTMLVFLFMELTKGKKIHLFHYLLVGLALVLFFSVLTALSEHVGFNMAYWIAAAVIVSLVGFYSHGILKDKVLTRWVVVLLLILYCFLFVLLQLNDFAFLAGNIGLVVVLGIIMKASLKLANREVEA